MEATAKERIIKKLREVGQPLAIHEFGFPDISENAIGTRLPELAQAGLVVGSFREGKPFKEWRLATEQESIEALPSRQSQPIHIEEESWVGDSDQEGLPFFTEEAFDRFVKDVVSFRDGVLDSVTYKNARQQLWAVREQL